LVFYIPSLLRNITRQKSENQKNKKRNKRLQPLPPQRAVRISARYLQSGWILETMKH